MKVFNNNNISFEELQARLKVKYSDAEIKKPFLTPRTIIFSYDNFKMFVRDKKSYYQIDFNPPVIWIIGGLLLSVVLITVILSLIYGQFVFGIGGALWIVLSVFIVKAIFKSQNKEKFESFRLELEQMVNH